MTDERLAALGPASAAESRRYRATWRIALDQLIRLRANGVTFDGRTFDEGYGSKGPIRREWRRRAPDTRRR